ncbi:hypothetical protein JG688_00014222 [Phytophthora aleatoria]|uniref:Uncharacterized protein n=1 Tax=Phytophthora aleatoria TaxID=2496075 RepID=A0A8J5I7P9_9STRA|nr:hypothetical protein JG688_00014222 [Phytophthora aleatoria]
MKDVQGQGRDRSLEGEVGPDPDGETRIAAEVEVGAVKGSSDGSQCMGEILEPPNHDVAVQLLTNADTTLHDSIHRMPDAGLSLIDIRNNARIRGIKAEQLRETTGLPADFLTTYVSIFYRNKILRSTSCSDLSQILSTKNKASAIFSLSCALHCRRS